MGAVEGAAAVGLTGAALARLGTGAAVGLTGAAAYLAAGSC